MRSFPIHIPTCPNVSDMKKTHELCDLHISMNTDAPINSKHRQPMLANLPHKTTETEFSSA